jgi:hypothetical protein
MVVEPSGHAYNVIATQIQVPAYGYIVTREGLCCVCRWGSWRGSSKR